MIIIKEPNDMGLTRSPLLYVINDPNYTNVGFKYLADVYIWAGVYTARPATPQHQLKIVPFASGEAYFNAAEFVNPRYDHPAEQEHDIYPSFGMALNIQLSFGYEDETGSYPALLDSLIVDAVDGYTLYEEGIDGFIQTYDEGGALWQKWLTDRGTLIPTFEGVPFPLGLYYNGKDPIKNVEIWDDNGGGQIIDLSTIADVTLGAETTFLHFQLGYKIEGGSLPDVLNPTRFYYVKGLNAALETVSKTYTFDIQQCARHGIFSVRFLNRYGTYEVLNFIGKRRDSLKVDRQEWEGTPIKDTGTSIIFEPHKGQQHHSFTVGSEGIEVNSGWVSEDDNEVFKQLMQSELVLDNITGLPLLVESTTQQFKTYDTDKNINYRVRFRKAYNSINTIS